MSTFTYENTLTVIECAQCHMDFAMSKEFNRKRREDHESFYCPAGHRQYFAARSQVEKLKDELERENRRVANLRARLDQEHAEAQHQARRAAAARGQLTKLRNRVARGVCPDLSCKRSFTDVAEHVRTCHPDLIESLG